MSTLPKRKGVNPYGTRPLAGITHTVCHHTTGPNSLTAHSIAAYQTGPDSPIAYPAIAYHRLVLEDGTIVAAPSLRTLTWHCGSGSVSSHLDDQGHFVGSNNWHSVGIAFCGENPTPAQIIGMRVAAEDIDRELGVTLERTPHRVISRGLTECPGNNWYDWWSNIL